MTAIPRLVAVLRAHPGSGPSQDDVDGAALVLGGFGDARYFMAMSHENMEIVRRMYEAFASGDADGTLAFSIRTW